MRSTTWGVCVVHAVRASVRKVSTSQQLATTSVERIVPVAGTPGAPQWGITVPHQMASPVLEGALVDEIIRHVRKTCSVGLGVATWNLRVFVGQWGDVML